MEQQEFKKKSLGLNAVLNGIRTVLNLFFPLITFPYVSRVLKVESIGKYNFAQSVNQYFLLLAALGISTYAIREGTKIRNDREKFNNFSSEIFSINLVSMMASYVILFLCVIFIPKFQSYRIIILIFSIELIFTTIGIEWMYSIYEEYAYITIRSIIFKVLSIILLFVLVKKPEDYIVYAGITVFANAGSNILNLVHSKKYCTLKIVLKKNLLKHLKPIMIIFACTVATSIYVNSDTTMLGFMTTNYEVGIYSVSSKVYRIVKQMLASILVVSIPRLAFLMGQKKMDEYKKTLTNIFNVLVILMFPAIVGLFLLSKEIVLLISGPEYIQATNSLRLLAIALTFCIFGWIYNQCVLIPAKQEKIVMFATILSAVANIALNFVLIPLCKVNAVAISTIVAEGISMAVCVYYGKSIVKLGKGVVKNGFTVCIGCIPIVIICILIQKLNLSIVLTLFWSIGFSAIGYGMTLVLLKNELIITYLNKRIKSNR